MAKYVYRGPSVLEIAGVETGNSGSGTVCPGSSDPPEKSINIFASENENYYNTLG